MKFLIRLPFAIFLMVSTALLVLIGTWIEAKTESHGQAAVFIYSHPLFILLLIGFFINILGSALSRYPYKKQHIPFLITHLGLLMIIAGVMIKSFFGVQGHLFLIEGTASNELVLPESYALKIYSKEQVEIIPLKKSLLGNYYFSKEIPFQFLKLSSHGEGHLQAWLNSHSVQLKGFPKIPLIDLPVPLTLKSGYTVDLFANHSNTLEEDLQTISKQQIGKPFLFIHQSPEKKTTLLLSDAQGITSSLIFDAQNLISYNAYDEGFQGYTLQADLPFWNLKIEEKMQKELQEAEQHASLAPPLKFISQICKKQGEDFASTTTLLLKNWAREKSWLYDQWQLPLDWTLLSKDETKALYWMATLFQEDLLPHLETIKWPLLHTLKELPQEQVHLNWMAQLYGIRKELPEIIEPIDPITSSKMLSAFLRLYQIHWSSIPTDHLPPESMFSFESPLTYAIHEANPPQKLEKADPILWLQKENQTISLLYDRQGNQLKVPLTDGKHCLKFQQMSLPLPFVIRLHRARNIKFPGSEQTYSYECDLSLIESNQTIPVELKMNQVFETKDGYRLYLAGIGSLDNYGSKSVQLVINRDPAKYWLTYPGAVLVAFGIILLFWKRW